MRDLFVYIFPSLSGYQFLPADVEEKSRILASLQMPEIKSGEATVITPFLDASWIKHSFPSSKAMFIAGLNTRGIKNEAHRGSYSTWAVAKIITRKTSFSADEGLSIMADVVTRFKAGVTMNAGCGAFFSAFQEYVSTAVDQLQIEKALAQLSVQAFDANSLRNLRSGRRWLDGVKRYLK